MGDPDRYGVSFIVATRNRRDVLLETIGHVHDCGLDRSQMEVFVVDNASTDGTPAAIARRWPQVHLLPLSDNRGSCAKALALPEVRFRYVMHLDDDSWPMGDAIPRMLDRFEQTPSLAAVGFAAVLPDGRVECSALPDVFIGCGVGLRTDVLRRVGGLDESFFMQAEEYDLAFRIAGAGYQVRTFDDLRVRHLKSPQSRYGHRTAYYDTRNNIVVACRFLSGPWLRCYLTDWIRRYAWLSRTSGNGVAFARGMLAGLWRAGSERLRGAARPITPRAFEAFFRIQEVEQRMGTLRSGGVRRILFADLGKNILAYWRAAKVTGIEAVAIADDRFANGARRRYRGLAILTTRDALRIDVDAIVVANTSYAHAYARAKHLADLTHLPIHDWFGKAPRAAGAP